MKVSENSGPNDSESAEVKVPVNTGLRGFRASEELENLYRFVSDLGLRKEVKLIFQRIFSTSSSKRKGEGKSKLH